MSMTHRIYLNPMWLRVWHWLNALLFLLLIISGISLHYSGLNSFILSFDTARIIHNTSGIVVSILYFGFFVSNFIFGNWKYYVPSLRGITSRLLNQIRYYLIGIFKGEVHPYHPSEREKFNPMQQFTYLMIMYCLMPVLVVTGLLLLFPEYAPDKVLGAGGIWPMAVLHSVAAFFLTIFMVGHIYLATTGETVFSFFEIMFTGWHTVHTTVTIEKER